jgi:hypothetical protein
VITIQRVRVRWSAAYPRDRGSAHLFTLAPGQVGRYRANFRFTFTECACDPGWFYEEWVVHVGSGPVEPDRFVHSEPDRDGQRIPRGGGQGHRDVLWWQPRCGRHPGRLYRGIHRIPRRAVDQDVFGLAEPVVELGEPAIAYVLRTESRDQRLRRSSPHRRRRPPPGTRLRHRRTASRSESISTRRATPPPAATV